MKRNFIVLHSSKATKELIHIFVDHIVTMHVSERPHNPTMILLSTGTGITVTETPEEIEGILDKI